MTLPFSQQYGPPHASNPYVVDGLLQFYPYKLMLRDAWLHGRFDFWNPHNLCGFPQYAETMATNFDVLNVILLLAPMPLAFHIYLISPLFIAGIGLYLFLRSYSIHTWIARLFATAYMLSGLFITHLLPHFIPGSFCWLPFICLALRYYLKSPSIKLLTLCSIALALGFLGGNIQTSGFLVFVVAVFGLYTESGKTLIPRLTGVGLIVIIAFLLSAIMWFPTLEYVYQASTVGAVRSSSLTREYSILERILTIPLLFTFFLPQLAGPSDGLSIYNLFGLFTIDFNAAISYFPLLLGGWACIRYWKNREIRTFTVLTAAGLLLPIATPLYHYLYHRFFIVACFSLCCSGAIGFDHALRKDKESLHRFLSKSRVIFAAFTILYFVLAFFITLDHDAIFTFASRLLSPKLAHAAFAEGNPAWIPQRIKATIDHYSLNSLQILLPLLSISIGYAVLLRKKFDNTNLSLITLWSITAFQGAFFTYSWLPHVEAIRYPLFPKTELTDKLACVSPARTFIDRRAQPGKQYIFIDNENVAYGISQVSGFESLLPRCFYLTIPSLFDDTTKPAQFLGALNTQYVVSEDSKSLSDTNLTLSNIGALNIYSNHAIEPRVQLKFERIEATDSDAIKILKHGSLNDYCIVAPKEENIPALQTHVDSNATIRIQHETPECITLYSVSTSPAYLLLSDTYYPGWHAYIDSKEAKVYRTNYAMRAVVLPQGSHTIILRFEPSSFKVGMWTSATALSILVCFLVYDMSKKRKKRHTSR